MSAKQSTSKKASLYERLGGEAGIRKIVNDTLDKNYNNPDVGHFFQDVDMAQLKQRVFEFFSMGAGGPHQYTGKDMATAHTGLNISKRDFDIADRDTIEAIKENGVAEAEIQEVIGILGSMRPEIIGK